MNQHKFYALRRKAKQIAIDQASQIDPEHDYSQAIRQYTDIDAARRLIAGDRAHRDIRPVWDRMLYYIRLEGRKIQRKLARSWPRENQPDLGHRSANRQAYQRWAMETNLSPRLMAHADDRKEVMV
jgi:hypothetical protein